MVLYTCEIGKAFGGLPGPVAIHAAEPRKPSTRPGCEYEHRTVKGESMKVWTWPSRYSDSPAASRASERSR